MQENSTEISGFPTPPDPMASLSGLWGPAISFHLIKTWSSIQGPLLAIAPSEEIADRILGDCRTFARLFGKEEEEVNHFPARGTDTNTSMIPDITLAAKRTSVLHSFLETKNRLIIASLQSISQKTLPKDLFLSLTELLEPGLELDRERLLELLFSQGYQSEERVEEPGAYCVRGGLVDVFPPHLSTPVRIDFFGDEIEAIRSFDPDTQRSLDPLQEVTLIPTREALWKMDRRQDVKSRLKDLADHLDLPRMARGPLEEAIEDGRLHVSMEALLPIFYDQLESALTYSDKGLKIITCYPFELRREAEALQGRFSEVTEEIQSSKKLLPSPWNLSEKPIPLLEKLEGQHPLFSDIQPDDSSKEIRVIKTSTLEELRRGLRENRKSEEPFAILFEHLEEHSANGFKTVFLCHSDWGESRLTKLLEGRGLDWKSAGTFEEIKSEAHSSLWITRGDLSESFVEEASKMVFLTDEDIFGHRKHTVQKEVKRENFFASISELHEGDTVVHIDHGVGIYQGLKRIEVRDISNDFLLIEYADQDKLYLPVYKLNRVQKYVGSDGKRPKIDRLGNQSSWEKTRKKAKKAIEEMAKELIELYAARRIAEGDAFSPRDTHYQSFEEDFPFEETRDQLQAIEDVSSDQENKKPMDRLICGDVGFGKTEVALRAAFRVAMEGKQVALLVPTTVLAQQHFETFQARFSDFPVKIGLLSRFRSSAELRQTVSKLKDGTLDIVIGTHRLLSKDVSFARLGLLVIDEEHRFGVRHKERIKRFRNRVDVLTLTATPIPRTLQMSLSGIRDLSVINTPPLDRKAVKTYLCRFEDDLIRGAISKELERKGQVFFLHNRVETIDAMGIFLRKLVPNAKIEIAHGQMPESALEEKMMHFVKKEIDVLLCTTIIESGLDVPNANTILMNRADRLGLAQLYQLRGRVGRSDREAYAYLLIPGEELITKNALKRLKVLKRFTELGSGLKIALHDLEIRGAGNLLGASQSGQIAAIGLELYTQLLDREIRRLKGEKVAPELDPEIQTQLPAYIPDEYVGKTGEKLVLYKRLSSVSSSEKLEETRAELLDRFGPIPPTVENLLRIIELKILARKAGATALRINDQRPIIAFAEGSEIAIDPLLRMLRKDRRLQLHPDHKLTIQLDRGEDPFEETEKILNQLSCN